MCSVLVNLILRIVQMTIASEMGVSLNFPSVEKIKFSKVVPQLPKRLLGVDAIDSATAMLPVRMDLSGLELRSIPPSVRDMIRNNEGKPMLKVLNLSSNALSNDDIKILADALRASSASESLEVLDLSSNNIVAPIPAGILDTSGLPKLRLLILSNNTIPPLGNRRG